MFKERIVEVNTVANLCEPLSPFSLSDLEDAEDCPRSFPDLEQRLQVSTHTHTHTHTVADHIENTCSHKEECGGMDRLENSRTMCLHLEAMQ